MPGGREAYEQIRADFRWNVPERFNIGTDICRWADGSGRTALIFVDEAGTQRRYSFDDLDRLSDRFANALVGDRLQRGDRLAILLPQSPEVPVGHAAAFKAGLITVPLFVLFGEEALVYRLGNSGARAILTDAEGAAKILSFRDRLPDLQRIYVTGSAPPPAGCLAFNALLEKASDRFQAVHTADDLAGLCLEQQCQFLADAG